MANSLRAKIKKLYHDRKITDGDMRELIVKLDGHDKELYNKAIDDFVEKIQWEYENGCGITQRQIYFLKAVSNQVAEQLKAGEPE